MTTLRPIGTRFHRIESPSLTTLHDGNCWSRYDYEVIGHARFMEFGTYGDWMDAEEIRAMHVERYYPSNVIIQYTPDGTRWLPLDEDVPQWVRECIA